VDIDAAREIAVVVDAKALGQAPSPTPTPGSKGNILPPLPSPTAGAR
jgi:hypothetical protein